MSTRFAPRRPSLFSGPRKATRAYRFTGLKASGAESQARNPSRYLSDSNLDWGQDLLRLRRFCRRRGITTLPRALFTASDLDALGLPPNMEIDWTRPLTVPVALSESTLVAGRMGGGAAFHWADDQPYVRVGKSIRVYGLTSP
jgi:hypothetical protein